MNTLGETSIRMGQLEEAAAPPVGLEGADCFQSTEPDAGWAYHLQAGALRPDAWITFDMLSVTDGMATFSLRLYEAGEEEGFTLLFALLPFCQARVRFPLAAVDLNRWQLGREGAWLKPMCWGSAVGLERVDRAELLLSRKAPGLYRWWQTVPRLEDREPPRIVQPLLPEGPLLDRFGQSATRDWPAKTRSMDELVRRLTSDAETAADARWPTGWSRWGGWSDGPRAEASGFFQTHHDGSRWWLVDPDGYPFWSAGVDCVRSSITSNCRNLRPALSWHPADGDPDAGTGAFSDAIRGPEEDPDADFLRANLIRAFGPDAWRQRWEDLAYAAVRRFGFNTIGNWSDTDAARRSRVPYVYPLRRGRERAPRVFRDFPDVFHPAYREECNDAAAQLRARRDDPALIGYFLMNEPQWGFAGQTPAEGMLLNTEGGPAREALAAFMAERYGDAERLSEAWEKATRFEDLAAGRWSPGMLSPAARADLERFSTVMVEKLFSALSEACRRVDPDHLNLGARYYTTPPDWALRGMGSFSCFSINAYRETIAHDAVARIVNVLNVPVLIGEWHFGALDVGLPASGIGHVRDQAARGRAYRRYLEDAAADPNCVGAHWFTLYDQSALGRFDGEAYNIGFLDVCHRPYAPIAEAARRAHARLYAVATGEVPPFDDAPEYLPKVFI